MTATGPAQTLDALKPYPAYKDSGVEWIGDIPQGWTCLPIKKGYSIQLGKMLQPQPTSDASLEVEYLRAANVQDGWIDTDDIKTMFMSAAEASRFSVEEGDLLILEGGEIGRSALVPAPMAGLKIQNSLHRVRGVSGHTRFLHYAMQHVRSTGLLDVLCNKATIQHLTGDKLASLVVSQPPGVEQATIAAFLDHETDRIDALVREQEQLLEDIKEKRQATVDAAVTGQLLVLAPSHKTVDGIGKIPSHWKVIKLKRLAQVRGGVTKGRDLQGTQTTEVAYLRVANVQDGYLNLDDIATIEIPVDELDRYLLKVGDVLMNEGGDNDKLGRGAVWHGQISPCAHQNHVFSVRPHGVDSDWLALINTSSYAKFYFFSNSKQSTNLASISSSNIKELPVVLPPAAERQAILTEVNQRLAQINELVAEVHANIEDMKLLRSTLITAATTGKIDVRDWKPV